MAHKLLFALISIFVAFAVEAKGSSYTDPGTFDPPAVVSSADIIYKIPSNSITYRADGYMLVCTKYDWYHHCEKDSILVEVSQYFRNYFTSAPKIRIVGKSVIHDYFVFYLNRE